MTGIQASVMRDGRWVTEDIDKLSSRELDALIARRAELDGWDYWSPEE